MSPELEAASPRESADDSSRAQRASSGAPVPKRTLVTVWVTLFLDLVGFGMIIPVLPYYATFHGASPAVVALLSTSFSIAQFIMSPVLGRISDRFGRRPVMLISIAGSFAAMLILGLAQTLAVVFLARVVSGMANANISTARAYVADRVEPHDRARYMGIMGAAIGLGFIFGPAIGGLLSSPEHRSLPFFVSAGLAAVNWLMAFTWLPESLSKEARESASSQAATRGWAPLRWSTLQSIWGTQLGWLIVLNFGFFFAFAAMESTFALFTEARLGWGARETGYMFTGIGVVIVLVQGMGVGRLVAFLGEKRTLVAGLLVLCAGLLLAATSQGVVALAIGGGLIAAGNGFVTPSIGALVSRFSSERDQGLNLGLAASAASFARIIGPIIGGMLFELQNEGAPMLMGSVTALLAALVAVLSVRRPE